MSAQGWTLNLPSGNDEGLSSFHETLCQYMCSAHTFLLKILFRAAQVPLVMQGLQARTGLPDPPAALVLREVQDPLGSEVSPAHQEKKGPQEHEEKG